MKEEVQPMLQNVNTPGLRRKMKSVKTIPKSKKGYEFDRAGDGGRRRMTTKLSLKFDGYLTNASDMAHARR